MWLYLMFLRLLDRIGLQVHPITKTPTEFLKKLPEEQWAQQNAHLSRLESTGPLTYDL
jgi:hypothetical protein